MVDPVSLEAVLILLASKYGEGFVKDAGSSSWRAVVRLPELIAQKFGRGAEAPAALAELKSEDSVDKQIAAAEIIDAAVRTDPEFAASLRELIDTARKDHSVDVFVANAYDQARQVNISGDNTGTITLN